MAITRDGSGSGRVNAAGSTTLVITFGTNANRLCVVAGSCSNGGPPTVADNTATGWTVKSNIAASGSSVGEAAAFVAYRENAPALTSVTLTWGASVHANAALDQFAGAKTSSAFDTQTDSDGVVSTDSWGSGNLTAGANGALIVAAGSGDDSATDVWVSAGGSWTDLVSYGDTNISVATYTAFQIAGATTGPFSLTFNYQGMSDGAYAGVGLLVSFLPPAGGPDITSTSSATPQEGDTLTITGTGFGASQGAGSVTIGGVTQTVTSWSATSIDVTVVRGTNKHGVSVNVIVTDNSLNASSPFALTNIAPATGWTFIDLVNPNLSNTSGRLSSTPDLATGDQIAYESLSGGVIVAANATFSAVNTVQSFRFEVWTASGGWGSIATQEIVPPALQRLRRSLRARTHTKLWRREGWVNTRFNRAGWFNKDLILPAAESGDIAGSSDIVITPTGTLLGAGALVGTAALQFGAGSSAITGAGALLGTAGIAITPTGAIAGAGALAGSSAVTLTPTAVLLGAGALEGTSAFVFTPAATMAGAGSLAGSLAIAFTPTATVAGAGDLAGTSDLVFTPAATLAGVGTLAGSIAIAFTPTGSVAGAGALAGSSALVFGGSLIADDSIAGVAALVFTPTATPQGAGELAGTSALVFDASASMLGAGELIGAAALVFGGAATLEGVGELAGSVAIQFTPEGTLDGAGVGEMAGTASLVFDGAGLFTGVGALAGTAASTLLASGNLTFTGGTDLAAEVWNYVLNNGKTAEQNMVDILADVESLLARSCTDENVQAGYNVGDAFRILLAVAAGKSRIDSLGGGAAHVEFDAIDDSGVVVAADMQGSERVDVTLTPEETS